MFFLRQAQSVSTFICSTVLIHQRLSLKASTLVMCAAESNRRNLDISIGGQRGGGPLIMTHHHSPKIHCSNDDVILCNTYGHQTPPLPTYEADESTGCQFVILKLSYRQWSPFTQYSWSSCHSKMYVWVFSSYSTTFSVDRWSLSDVCLVCGLLGLSSEFCAHRDLTVVLLLIWRYFHSLMLPPASSWYRLKGG